ncbi:MAG: RNA polymerase sigma factor [Cytophagales bacterium]|nr:MAG: RNA polymerase sigma factor [Cytophagales bacterium]TAF61478.1 MAG: RNA polymerase sigma factor [Cytophagales bacterium]
MQHHDDLTRLFTQEFIPCERALLAYAYKLTHSHADAQDLVQDTFIKAFKNIDKYHQNSNAKAWLLKILYNTFATQYRAKKNLHELSIDDSQESQLPSSYRAVSFESDFSDETLSALKALPEELRLTILLCDVHGYKTEEVALLMGISEATSRTRLHKARLKLRRKLCSELDLLKAKELPLKNTAC